MRQTPISVLYIQNTPLSTVYSGVFVSFGVVLATSATGDSFADFNFVARVARHIAVPFIDNPKPTQSNSIRQSTHYKAVALRLSP